MLPETIALVEDDAEFSNQISQHLSEIGLRVSVFDDSDSLLTDGTPYDYGFYMLDLSLPGIDGVDLIRILRRRTEAGILVVSGRMAADAFDAVILAGADMYLAKPIREGQVVLAIKAVHRRVSGSRQWSSGWTVDRHKRQLLTPDGSQVDLSETDLAVLECFLDAQGETVERERLRRKLKLAPGCDSDNLLHATIYRLRRRIERATPVLVPLQSRSRKGYVFRGTITSVGNSPRVSGQETGPPRRTDS